MIHLTQAEYDALKKAQSYMPTTGQVAAVRIVGADLQWLMARALNTLEPEKWPEWVKDLDEGVRGTDKCTILLARDA